MKNTKPILMIMIFCSLFILNATFDAGAYPLQQYSINTVYPGRMGSGGPFYAQALLSGVSFSTYCIELSETIHGGTNTYWGTNDTYADMGGVDLDPPAGDGRDYLAGGTKLLYNYFLDQEASTLDADHKAAIQLAIWRLEDEVNTNYDPTFGGTIGFTPSAAIIGFANNYYDGAKNGTLSATNREIMVLNLYGYGTGGGIDKELKYQSLLIPVPTPETGTMLFLGAGLIGIALIKRKRQQT